MSIHEVGSLVTSLQIGFLFEKVMSSFLVLVFCKLICVCNGIGEKCPLIFFFILLPVNVTRLGLT